MHAEDARQWVHVGSGLFALLLRVLTPWQAAGLAAFALAFNVIALPRIGGRRLYRAVDETRGFPLGILLYPLSILLLTLIFPSRPDITAVPASAAAVLWLASLMDASSFASTRPALIAAAPWALGVNALTAWLGHRARTVSRSGAMAGAIVGIAIYSGGGGRAWILLFAAFLAASIASRLGLKRKRLLGIA